MSSWANFLKYNNAVPLVAAFLFLSFSGAMAASPEARDLAASAILSSEERVISVDNTYIANKDLSAYSPTVRITSVTEDSDYYYVAYTFSTIGLKDYVWKDVTTEEVLKVSKADLGTYRDLGLYATEQLNQRVARELSMLRETQEFERRNVTQQVVATSYGGLIGAFINSSTQVVPGYTPVVMQPATETAAENTSAQPTETSQPQMPAVTESSPLLTPVQSGDSNITLQVMGNNPAIVDKGASYVDLGVYVVDPGATNVGYKTYLDGTEVSTITIDTSMPHTYTVEYRLVDRDGNTVSATRTIIVAGGTPVPSHLETVIEPVSEISTSTQTE